MKTVVQISADLLINELMPRFKEHGVEPEDSPVSGETVALFAQLKSKGLITTHAIRALFDLAFDPRIRDAGLLR